MNILIIGSEGFIGSNLNRNFQAKGNSITALDIIEKKTDNIDYFNITHTTLREIFTLKQYDIAIFCAGNANVQKSFSAIDYDFLSNTKFVHDILFHIKDYQKNCKFLHISSAAVYGNPTQIPIAEHAPKKPISPYGFHKYQAELICEEFNTLFNIPTCSIRPFSVYGPGQKKLLFWDIYQKTQSHQNIQLQGNGTESRDFIYIDDFVDAVNCIINNATFNNDIINIANGNEVTIKECVETFIKVFDDTLEYEFNGINLIGNPLRWAADITQLKSFGYQQKISLEQGLEKYKKWIEENQF